MPDEEKLMLLRVQLYTAMQSLKGEALWKFWELINEIVVLRDHSLAMDRVAAPEKEEVVSA
jgi:hypothetical protein